MKSETQYTIAFIVATFANPTLDKWRIGGTGIGAKDFEKGGDLSQNNIDIKESGAGNIRGTGSGFNFSRVQVSGGNAEGFDLRLNGRRFDGLIYNEEREKFNGSVEGEEVRFDTGETYRLQ